MLDGATTSPCSSRRSISSGPATCARIAITPPKIRHALETRIEAAALDPAAAGGARAVVEPGLPEGA